MNDLSVTQLRMLRAVANEGTIAAAAEALGYTPSAVSQQLARLERSTGVAVLTRVGRNVKLTDAGRELVGHADSLLAGFEEARVALERVTSEPRGTLHMTIYESAAATLLPPLLARLGERYPDIHLRTRQADPDDAIEMLTRGEIDLAFTIDYPHAPAPPNPDVIRTTVLDDRFHVVVHADSDISGPEVPLGSLADRPFISSPVDMSCGRCVVAACRSAGFDPDVVHELDDYPTTLHLVRAGAGVALVPDLGLTRPTDGIRVLDVDPPFSRSIQLAHRSASAGRPAIDAVRDTLLEVAEEFAGGVESAENVSSHTAA